MRVLTCCDNPYDIYGHFEWFPELQMSEYAGWSSAA